MSEEQHSLQIHQYSISPEFFEKGYPRDGGPCKCSSVCCEGGVYADIRERDLIMAHRGMIKKYLDETQTTDDAQWFEAREFDDADFPSGRCVGTREINEKCAFLDKHGRCSLQVAAVEEGMSKWALKPLYCVLFPIEISNNVVGFDDMLQGDEQCCTVSSTFDTPLFEACRDEFIHLLGEDGYRMMEEHYKTLRVKARVGT